MAADADRGAIVVDVVASWSVLPATATEAGVSGIDGRESGTEDPNAGLPGRGWPIKNAVDQTHPLPTAALLHSAHQRALL